MGERTSYPPGTFSWVDLSTTDQEGAKAFYEAVFGWEYDDMPIGDGMTYTMCNVGGRQAAAISAQMEQERAAGVPPHWSSYVTVDDVDATAERARSLGGQVVAGPFDVFDSGRMAVLADPTGAFVSLWQPRQHIGASVVNEYGTLTWNDLNTSDLDAAMEFYGELFGWEFERVSGEFPYHVIHNEGRSNGGVMPLQQEGVPPHWLPYFAVESIEAKLRDVEGAGGRVLAGPIEVPAGSFAVAADPQGAVFAFFEGSLDD